MQKISSYLYPNRIKLLLDLPGFFTEYTNVFQRNVKLYKGIDNVIEFDIKNADQKRIDLNTLSDISMTVMDSTGNALPNSPYEITSIPALRGIATVTIPMEDLTDLTDQYLKYSITAMKDYKPIILYADTQFGVDSTIELISSAFPLPKKQTILDSFTSEIGYNNIPVHHSSAIPARFYESNPTSCINFAIYVTGFTGSIWISATKQGTITNEAFKAAGQPFGAWTQNVADGLYTGMIPYGFSIPVSDYTYFRVSYESPTSNGLGASFLVTRSSGVYNVQIRSGGTAYSIGSIIKVSGNQLGGNTGVNDLIITVTGVNASGSSAYTSSSILSVSWSGTASAGIGEHICTGKNYSGVINRVVVKPN
jgi:hypothetical protein